jgi:hypothetical protein
MSYALRPSSASFEELFREIADRNKLKTYHFVLYKPMHFGYGGDEIPETTIASLRVQSDYFQEKSLKDMEGQLVPRVNKRFDLGQKYYEEWKEFDDGLFHIPPDHVPEKDKGVSIAFPLYQNSEEAPDKEDIIISCLGISSICVPTEGEWRHLKHIDFGILAPTYEKDFHICYDAILRDLEEIKAGAGWLVHSGNSFHFHGRETLNIGEWHDYMSRLIGQAAKKDSSLDEDWPPIQLVRGSSILRIEESLEKEKPRIIAEVGE